MNKNGGECFFFSLSFSLPPPPPFLFSPCSSTVSIPCRKQLVGWQGLFDMGVQIPKELMTVEAWKCWGTNKCALRTLLQQGYTALQSTCFYLDWNFGVDEGFLKPMFDCSDPGGGAFMGTDQMLGAEMCVWTEHIDPSNLDCRAWPRGAVFADRFWHDAPTYKPTAGDYAAEAMPDRLQLLVARLHARGIGAAPMTADTQLNKLGVCPPLADGLRRRRARVGARDMPPEPDGGSSPAMVWGPALLRSPPN